MKGELNQDGEGQWWYKSLVGNKKRYYERICSCGKLDIVDKSQLDRKCQSCGLSERPFTEEWKKNLSKSGKGKKFTDSHKLKLSNSHKGSNNYNFKGFQKDNKGYILIYKPDHPYATKRGMVYDHRLVMEKKIGRFLTPEEEVHHIDGIKDHNIPENLKLFTNHSDHMTKHWNEVKSKLYEFDNIKNKLDEINKRLDYDLNKKKRSFIYLAGNISDDHRTYEWREEFIELTKDTSELVIVNPCGNKFNQGMRNVEHNGLEFIKEAKKQSQHLLRAKDYKMIDICNVMIVNLELISKEKPLIGTIQELCWAHDIFKIPVIAIVGSEESQLNNPYVQHPWIDECCSAKVRTVEEAVDMLKMFFLDY